MTAGLLIGHFEPLHLGHLQDINEAAGQCQRLHIIITPRAGDSRFRPTMQDKVRWVQVACQHFDFIEVHTPESLGVQVAGDYASKLSFADGAWQSLQQAWAGELTVFAKQGVMTDSDYPTRLLSNHDCDDDAIYKNPAMFFDKIAPSAKPDYTQTVCIVGGESSGKTTLVHKLANHYGASIALEMGRLYTHSDLGGTEFGLQYSDYAPIAINHAKAIFEAKKHATAPIVLVDTDFATTQAFCEAYEGRTHPLVANMADEIRMDFTIYLDNNVKWVADGMRRLGSEKQRSAFATRLLSVLARHQIDVVMIDDADYHERYRQAVAIIDKQVLGMDDAD